MTSNEIKIEHALYETLFPEKAQAAREAIAIGEQLVASIKHFNATFFAVDIFGEPVAPAKPAAPSYIGTVTKFGRYYSAKVLASNGREVIAVCSRESEDEAVAYTEQKYPGVAWVLENRFNQEVACL